MDSERLELRKSSWQVTALPLTWFLTSAVQLLAADVSVGVSNLLAPLVGGSTPTADEDLSVNAAVYRSQSVCATWAGGRC